MADHRDTIAAIATPGGRGGIAVVRVSGPASMDIARAVSGITPEPGKVHFAAFKDSRGAAIDRGLLLYFRAPASYTGEDVLELHGHGGRSLPRLLLGRVIELGARLAAAGEFTQRAFLNDKLDLLQAEAVADLVDSGSERAARSAMRSLEGVFSKAIDAIVNELISLRVNVEGALDFPDEELELLQSAGLEPRLAECLEQLQRLLDSAGRGRVLREGLRIVILGAPNVGKSSLLNCLSRTERAIVTETPGTTRDLIEDEIMLDGMSVNVVDTAGIRETGDPIEREGMERALAAAEKADVIVLIQDARDSFHQELAGMQRLKNAGGLIIVNNKIDLAGTSPAIRESDEGRTVVDLSASSGAGVDLLIGKLQELSGGNAGEDVIMARDRHVHALRRARSALEQGAERLREHGSTELLAEDLRSCQSALGEITGVVAADDLLGEIFSRFCIGK